MQNYNKEDVLYAGFFVRLSAYILDWIIVGLALLVVQIPRLIVYIINPDAVIFKPILFKFSLINIIIYLLGLSYFVFMTYYYGATFGKKAFNLKVCKSNDKKLTLIDVIYRESIGRYLSSIVLCFGYIIILADSKKRGFHDMLCDTNVVYSFKKKTNNTQLNNANSMKQNIDSNNIVNNEIEKIDIVNNEENILDENNTVKEDSINDDNLKDKENKIDLDKE